MCVFATTHWSLILAAQGESPAAREALAELCRLYWYPLYAYIRRRGRAADEAQDLTQEFFARLLERDDLAGLDPARGRFRAFLLTDHLRTYRRSLMRLALGSGRCAKAPGTGIISTHARQRAFAFGSTSILNEQKGGFSWGVARKGSPLCCNWKPAARPRERRLIASFEGC
jgi:hypothetical protein